MDSAQRNKHVIHPKALLIKEKSGIRHFNTSLALKVTNGVGTMWTAYLFTILSLLSLPAILTQANFVPRNFFPSWIIATSLIALVSWIAQTFLQLVLLPVIMVGQNVIQDQQDAKAEADHQTLTYLMNLQEEQMQELKFQKEILEYLKKKIKE